MWLVLALVSIASSMRLCQAILESSLCGSSHHVLGLCLVMHLLDRSVYYGHQKSLTWKNSGP